MLPGNPLGGELVLINSTAMVLLQKQLSIIKAIIDELDNTCYAIVGDWNANLKDIDNSLFANHMLNGRPC